MEVVLEWKWSRRAIIEIGSIELQRGAIRKRLAE